MATFRLLLLILLCALPALWLVYGLFTDNLGANPVETLTHETGNWAIIFLLLTLSMTPIQQRFKIKWSFIIVRRTLGLSAFVYALLHLMIYVVFDHAFYWPEILEDIIDRPFILIGFISFVMLIPLAITSTQNWQKRLKQTWRKLHKWVYAITFLGILHFALLVKADYVMPIFYMLIFALLMMARYRKN